MELQIDGIAERYYIVQVLEQKEIIIMSMVLILGQRHNRNVIKLLFEGLPGGSGK